MVVLQEDIKTILGKDRLKSLDILRQLSEKILDFCIMLDFFCKVLRVGSSSLEVGNHRYWKYLDDKKAVSKLPVSTISTGEEELMSILIQVQGIDLCFLLLSLFLL